MPIFHLNLRDNGTLWPDQDGAEFASLDEAYLEAFAGAQEMWTPRLRDRKSPLSCAFEITDAAGNILLTLPFSEVLDCCRGIPFTKRMPGADGTALRVVDRSRSLRSELSDQLKAIERTICATRGLLARAPAGG